MHEIVFDPLSLCFFMFLFITLFKILSIEMQPPFSIKKLFHSSVEIKFIPILAGLVSVR